MAKILGMEEENWKGLKVVQKKDEWEKRRKEKKDVENGDVR